MAAHTNGDDRQSVDDKGLQELVKTASRLVARGKGLLASDESVGTIGKRIEKAGLANTEVPSTTPLPCTFLILAVLANTVIF